MNQTKPYRDMRRHQYTAELVANARMVPDCSAGGYLDMLIHARNDYLLSPQQPAFAGSCRDRDDRNEWTASTVWRMYRSGIDCDGLMPETLVALDIDSDPQPRHWMVRRYRHDTEFEQAAADGRLPWFLRRQAS